jgi:hypothetical protein
MCHGGLRRFNRCHRLSSVRHAIDPHYRAATRELNSLSFGIDRPLSDGDLAAQYQVDAGQPASFDRFNGFDHFNDFDHLNGFDH